MKIFKFLVLILGLGLLGSCTTTEKITTPLKTLSYILQPDPDGKSINIQLELQGLASGQTRIRHSKTWAGNDFTKDITDLKLLTAGAQMQPTLDGDKNHITQIITHKSSDQIKITYKVTQNVPSPDKNYRALVTKKYFHLIGQAFLITPDLEDKDENEIYKINLSFKNFPKDYKFANSFFVNKSQGTFKATLDEFSYAVYVGGDFRIKKIKINNKPLFVSLRGKWQFKDEDFFKLAENIVTYQRNFFQDHNFDQFLINLIPNERACCSSGGTGLTDSFATFLPNDATLESHVKTLLSHELFHTWNGRRIARQEPEELVYWFSEGFTDYYSRLLLLRSGDLTLPDFVDDYNEVLYEYYTSDAINYPNQRILKDFWKNYQVEKLPYRRGNILARKWDAQIKEASNNQASMDNILIDLFKEAQSKATVISDQSFIRLAAPYFSGGFQDDIKKFVDKGDTIIPGENDLGPCVQRIKSKVGKFEHGYDSEKTYKSLIMTNVNPKSAAYEAGLRNGQKMVGRKIHFPPTKHSWIEIQEKSGVVKTISFLPIRKGAKKTAYFFELNTNKFQVDPKSCLAWFEPNNL